jgi:Co/Zn/Cd efflux system component
MSFALIQTVAAYISGSEALMGDSAAMIVDALTYLFNLLAERKKNRFRQDPHSSPYSLTCIDPERAQRLQQIKFRKETLQLELITPLISVSTLLVVTGFIIHKAMHVLILDLDRDVSEQSDPNVHLMLLFSLLNLILDFVNVSCFAKANHALGYATKDAGGIEGSGEASNRHRNRRGPKRPSEQRSLLHYDEQEDAFQNGVAEAITHYPQTNGNDVTDKKATLVPLEIEELSKQEDDDDGGHYSNLNMCSAYTVSEMSDDQETEGAWRLLDSICVFCSLILACLCRYSAKFCSPLGVKYCRACR